MKLAIFTEVYPPSFGGQEIRFAEMAALIVKRGHSVSVFCVNNVQGCAAEESIAGVQIHRFPVATDYQQPMIKGLKRRPGVMVEYALWCREQSKRGFDACIYNQWPLLHIALAPSQVRRIAIADWCEVRSGRVFAGIQRFLPRLTAKNMAVSLAVKNHMEAVSGRPFTYVPSGVSSARYRSSPREMRQGLLYVGRISEHKNLRLLLTAFEKLRTEGYNGQLRIAGAGPGLAELTRQSEQSPFRKDMELLGFVSEEQKVRLLSTAEVLVIPSKREGFPRVVAEAMASGLPVVTADFPDNGTKEIVRHYGVGVVTDPNPGSLVLGIMQTLSQWSEYSRAGLVARDSLDWEFVVDEVLQLAS